MHRDLEDTASTFHGCLAGLHGFAAIFFARRALREYNAFHSAGRLIAWGLFHLVCAVISVIASTVHARDAR